MNRRRVFSLVVMSLTFAGCLSPETTDKTSDASNKTPDHSEGIYIVLQNGTAEQLTVDITIISQNDVFFQKETAVSPDEIAFVYPAITETGAYEIAVSTDQREQNMPFNVETYDLEMGSNIDVRIGTERIRIGKEE